MLKVEFRQSYADPSAYILNAPQICVAGRSNVGKSTFLNMIAQRKIAKTSSTPGRTRLINVFDCTLKADGDEFAFDFVDLPGYGYSALSKTEAEKLARLTDGYFNNFSPLQTFVLADCRHEPSKLDVCMIDFLVARNLPFTVIATKCDKVSRSERGRNIQKIAAKLKIASGNIIPTSAVNNEGREAVENRLLQIFRANSNDTTDIT